MKKLVTILLIALIALTSAFAVDLRFIVEDLDQHGEILVGFCPTYTRLGLGLDFHLIDENNTSELQLILGGGYTQRRVFMDPEEEKTEYSNGGDGIVYDVARGEFFIRFNQGFLDDLLLLRFSIENTFEANLDSFKTDKNQSLDDQFGLGTFVPTLYPDLVGGRMFLGTALVLRFMYDDIEDTIFTNDGIRAYIEAKVAPKFLNNWLDGSANYYSITANAVFAKTLYTYSTANYDWFSIVLIDRVNVNWTDGSVPVNGQGGVSLGRKVRGYNTYSYGTQFSAVNNFDIRFAGPGLGIASIKPRINLFFDLGLGAGNYYNTTLTPEKGVNFLSSVGAQFTVTFFDFIDLGYEIAYIFTEEKMTDPGKRFVTTFTFFLDF